MRAVRMGLLVGMVGQLTLLAGLTVTVGLSAMAWTVGVVCAIVTTGLLAIGLRRSGAVAIGPANSVTLARACLVNSVAALVTDAFIRPAHVPAIVTLAVVALVLDGVDGRVARKSGTVSDLGARFDMEVDAWLILVLSVYDVRTVGAWVLVIGAARYLLLVATWFIPWIGDPLPPSLFRKTVAALQGIALLVVAAGVLSRWAQPVLMVAAVLLLASFGHQLAQLARARRF